MITAADLAPSLNAPGQFFLVGCEPEDVCKAAGIAAAWGRPPSNRETVLPLPLPKSENDEGVASWEYFATSGPKVMSRFALRERVAQVDAVWAHVDLYGATGKPSTLIAAGLACDPTSGTERMPMNVLERLVRGGRAYWTRDYHRPALALSCDLYTAVWLELKPYVDYSGKLVHPHTDENLPIIADWLEEYGHPAVHCRLFLALKERIINSAWNPR